MSEANKNVAKEKPRFQQRYEDIITKAMQEKFSFKNVMQIPKLEKIVINMTAGNDVTNSKSIEEVQKQIEQITGQKPTQTVAKKSLAS